MRNHRSRAARFVVACCITAVCAVGVASTQWADDETKLTAHDGQPGDLFGWALDVSGDTAIVGAYGDDDQATDAGSAYVFVRSGGAWSEQQKLVAPDSGSNDWFGWSVAVSGDTALVGAYGDDDVAADAGAAYVFVRSGGVWTLQQKLTAPDGAAADMFGRHVALSGDTALVSSQGDDDVAVDAGAAYVFVRSGTSWNLQQKLKASDGAAGDAFGRAVAVDGDTVLLGAWMNDAGIADSGSAYVFVRNGGVWTLEQKLRASDGAAGDWFGGYVSLDGDTALISAHGDDDLGMSSGAAYVFERAAGVWTQRQKLTASDGSTAQFFGWDVAVSGDLAVIGAYGDDAKGVDAGAAYVFRRSLGTWTQERRLTASDGAAGDKFGGHVALSGDTALVAAELDDGKGSVWVRRLGAETPPSDTTAPVVVVPDSVFAYATSSAGAVVTYEASATDDVGVASFVCTPPSGSTFPVGATTVTCTAKDAADNTTERMFDVTVVLDPAFLVYCDASTLAALLPTGDRGTDERIGQAVDHLDKAFKPDIWADDFHLGKKGEQAFDALKFVVRKLDEPRTRPAIDEAVVADLVAAARALAQTAIDESGAQAKEVEHAFDEMNKAEAELATGHAAEAIEHFKHAWQHATKE